MRYRRFGIRLWTRWVRFSDGDERKAALAAGFFAGGLVVFFLVSATYAALTFSRAEDETAMFVSALQPSPSVLDAVYASRSRCYEVYSFGEPVQPAGLLDEACAQAEMVLGMRAGRRVVLAIARSPEQALWLGCLSERAIHGLGCYTQKGVAVVRWFDDPALFKRAVAHETAHALLSQANIELPLWINEALAVIAQWPTQWPNGAFWFGRDEAELAQLLAARGPENGFAVAVTSWPDAYSRASNLFMALLLPHSPADFVSRAQKTGWEEAFLSLTSQSMKSALIKASRR